MFEGDFKLNYHLAPPIDREEKRQGRAAKAAIRSLDAGAFKVLARLKGLRGTPLDIFGRTEERKHGARADRGIPRQHRGSDGRPERRKPRHGAGDRPPSRADQAATAMSRTRHLVAARSRWSELMGKWRDPQAQRVAA
jgi:indolepyruvate ferredoxin oxidoreductase